MALRLVNTAPGEITDAVKPGQFVSLGLKSELLKVPLASTLISMGLSNVRHHSLLPENDTTLQALGVETTLETSERRRPIDGTTPRIISGGSLVFTKSNLFDGELGIYELKMPIQEGASCLAYFKFKTKTAWTPFSADWCTLSNMTGMYFGLEHGTFNTAAYAFLRANTASGSLVVGGPLPAYSTVRPGQLEVLPGVPHAATPGFAWRSLPDNSVVEIYLFFNVAGYEAPPLSGVPINVPLLEVWTKIPTDLSPKVQAYIPVGSLGTFPSSLTVPSFTNSRPGVSETATLFFGNIARTAGSDVLELDDWAFFPDFRLAVNQGIERPNHNLLALPDAPVEFSAKKNLTPYELLPGRWFPDTGGLPPEPSLFFQPGRRGEALYTLLPKTASGTSAIHRTEPKLEERLDGVMLEAFIAGEVITNVGDGTGMGFAVEDGDKIYQVMMVGNPTRKYFGIVKDILSLDSALNGYHSPVPDADFTSPKMVRLVVDRRRPVSIGGGKAQLYIDEDLVLTTDLSADTFPLASSSVGKIRIGHLGLPTALSRLKLSVFNYLTRYLAWEGVDLLTPDNVGLNAGIQFTTDISGLGGHVMDGTDVKITKSSVGGGSRYTFVKNQSFAEVDGMQVDFQMKIVNYTDFDGASFPANSPTGATLTVFLGNKKVEIGFYDCGAHGRVVGILPKNGDVLEIINQTPLGRSLSSRVDWTQMNSFRLVIKGRDRVELTIGSPLNPPAITSKWVNDTDGFELPPSVSTPRLVFGHTEQQTTSISLWRYVRWGLSNGFEIAVQQEYPNGYPKYLFGGKALIKTEFDEA